MFYLTFVFLFSIINAKLPNDVRWVTTSSEYKYNCIQTYQMAYHAILEECNNKKQPVIIMDLDETILDNSNYQVGLFEKGEKYNPDSWSDWVNKKEAKLVPGAKEFILSYKAIDGAIIIYISNRMNKNLSSTKDNMNFS